MTIGEGLSEPARGARWARYQKTRARSVGEGGTRAMLQTFWFASSSAMRALLGGLSDDEWEKTLAT